MGTIWICESPHTNRVFHIYETWVQREKYPSKACLPDDPSLTNPSLSNDIQHKIFGIVCCQDVISWFDIGNIFKDPELLYLRSFEMNR